MTTIRINIKVSASEPLPESIGGSFEVNASGCVDVYRILRDRIHEMAPSVIITDPDADARD
jgi:hypothetical protein